MQTPSLRTFRADILDRYRFATSALDMGPWFHGRRAPASFYTFTHPLHVQRNPAKRTGLSMLGASWMGFQRRAG